MYASACCIAGFEAALRMALVVEAHDARDVFTARGQRRSEGPRGQASNDLARTGLLVRRACAADK